MKAQHYFSMAYVEGTSLAKKVADGPLPPREAAELLAKIATAVEYAHRQGIIHRDLKPANVLLDCNGQPRVTDFGLAKQMRADSGLTGTGQILGTPSYMPPEQASGKVDHIGPAADVYSLGAILYCLLIGRPPFQAASPIDTLRSVLEQEPAPARQLNVHVPRDLETICMKCLEKNPARRYATAAEFADDLCRYLTGEPILAWPASRLSRAVKWAKRRPTAAALLGVSVAAAVVLLVGAWRFQQERHARIEQQVAAAGQAALADERLWNAIYEKARQNRLSYRRVEALKLVEDARKIKETPELRREAVQAILSPGVRQVCEIPVGNVFSMKFSGDGGFLAIWGKYGYGSSLSDKDGDEGPWVRGDTDRVTVYRVPSGDAVEKTNLRGGFSVYLGGPYSTASRFQYAPFALSHDGSLVALVSRPGKLQLWKPARREPVGEPLNCSYEPCVFSPDGSLLAFARSAKGGPAIVLYDAAHGTTRVVVVKAPASRDIRAPIAFLQQDQLLVGRYSSAENWQRLWRVNLTTGEESPATPPATTVLALSGDGKCTALCPSQAVAGSPVTIWDLVAGRQIATVPDVVPNGQQSFAVQFSADGRRLAFDSPSKPGTFGIWDRASGQTTGFNGFVYGGGQAYNMFQRATFSPNGRLFISAQQNSIYAQPNRNILHLWDVDHRQKLFTLRDQHSPVWSGDGRFLATIAAGKITRPNGTTYGDERTFVRVWEITYPAPLGVVGTPVDFISMDPDGMQLAANGTIWRIENRLGRASLCPSAEKPTRVAAAFTPRGASWAVDCPTSWSEVEEKKPFKFFQDGPQRREVTVKAPLVPRTQTNGQQLLMPLYKTLAVNDSITFACAGLGYRVQIQYDT